MIDKHLKRVYELKGLVEDPSSSDAYFQNFEYSLKINPLKLSYFQKLEEALQCLDSEAWNELKRDVAPLLMKRHELRGWQPLFDRLNEVYGYKYLMILGSRDITFIPRAKKGVVQTPDLKGFLNGDEVLCEVKTINTSQEELIARRDIKARNEMGEFSDGFINKFTEDLKKACSQLQNYMSSPNSKLIAYFVTNFDNFTGEFDSSYFTSIRKVIDKMDIGNVEVIFHSEAKINT